MNKTIIFLITTFIAIFVVVSIPSKSLADSTTNCGNIYRNLYFGTRGNDVSALQHFLDDKGYFYGNITGYFGYMTYRSVVKWQRSEGINAIGVVGPQTRKRLRELCANPDPIPVYNFVPTNSCKSWFDGCNECARSTVGGPAACTQRACFAAGKGYCKSYFDNTDNNLPPVISGISGPTTINLNQTGTWTITASDPENKQLTYSILWGDEQSYYSQSSISSNSFSQMSTFTHSYSGVGVYTVSITVTDPDGQKAKSSITVNVIANTICTMEYAPVCGQPQEPACRRSNPACMIPTPGPRTYSNSCMLFADGATYLYGGACN